MTPTEQLLRETYTDIGERAPDASPVLERVLDGARARRRRRRRHMDIGLALAVAVIAVVVPLAVWPHHTESRYTTLPAVPTTPPLDIAPTWLPAGFVETERSYDPGGNKVDGKIAGPMRNRTFGKGSALIMVTDGALRDSGTWSRGETVVIGGRRGVVTASTSDIAADVQVPWRSGQLLEVSVTGAYKVGVPGARAIAIRVAQSVRSKPAVSLDIPLICSDPLCARRNLDVGGSARKWQASVGGPEARASLTYGYPGPPSDVNGVEQLTINGHPAVSWSGGGGLRGGAGVSIDLGGGYRIMINASSRRPLSRDEAVRVAKSVKLTGKSDYSWLGTRPG